MVADLMRDRIGNNDWGRSVNPKKLRAARQIVSDSLPDPQLRSTREVQATSRASANVGLISPDNCSKRIGILIVAYNAVTTIAKVLKRISADVWENIEEVGVLDASSR